jgi:hypothetical protein
MLILIHTLLFIGDEEDASLLHFTTNADEDSLAALTQNNVPQKIKLSQEVSREAAKGTPSTIVIPEIKRFMIGNTNNEGISI